MLAGMSAREFEEWKLLMAVRKAELDHEKDRRRQGLGRR